MAKPDLIHQRCANHRLREAVARCPECGRFFCRECITEHEDRFLCSGCLKCREPSPGFRQSRCRWLSSAAQWLVGLFLAFLFFFYLGQALLSLPHSFHEGTLWQESWWKAP